MKATYLLLLMSLLVWNIDVVSCQADDGNEAMEDLLEMSLSDLMDLEVEVAGTITETNPLKTPASVTTLTAEDIALTPARNLLDLMEIYVPGALYFNHSVGPVMGMRGIVADRPYKFLVNVNGINVNIKAHYGARLELLNWDLDDIDRVEIIRGPGSVTYGPGAIGGVINIYTKTSTEDKVVWNTKYWEEYESIGSNLSFSKTSDTSEMYGFISGVNTEGSRADIYGVNSSGAYGYLGTPGSPSSSPAASYMADYDNQPQVKAHVDLHFKDNWRFWARFNQANSELMQGSAVQYEVDGKLEDFRQTRYRYGQLALENHREVTDTWSLKQLYGISSIDVHNVEKWDSDLDNSRENLLNIGWVWSEHEFYARYMFRYEEEDNPLKGAIGTELSYDMIRPEWGDSADDGLRLAKGIISGPDSDAYGSGSDGSKQYEEGDPEYFPVGRGWETYTVSLLSELNYTFDEKNTALASARLDKHQYTDFLFSPRLAWIHQYDTDRFLKLIAQRSVRMNTQEELYMNKANGEDNDPEILDTIEAIFSAKVGTYVSYQTSLFWNRNDVIAYDYTQARSAPLGTLQSMGLELEGKYKRDDFVLGLNHSYVKQIDWDLDNGTVSGISYSDYSYPSTGISSNGNDLSNWSNHATKLYLNQQLGDGKCTLHGDLVTFWGFEGLEDGLDALENAGGDATTINDLREKDVYEMRMTANLSFTYRFSENLNTTLYVQNIPIVGDNKRYSYSSGYKKLYPDKTSWVEEPLNVGIRAQLKF